MSVSFATPLAATLVVLVGLVPLGVLLSERRRLHRLCGQLGLRPPQGRQATSVVIALTLLVALLALAAAQPVVATTTTERGRADAEAFFVLDTSRSMAAADAAGSPTRLDRARADAKELRARLPGLAVGVASLTDRVLPHLFPTMSMNDFNATLDESLAIDRPTSSLAYGDAVGTKLGALSDLVAANYFSPGAKRRAAASICVIGRQGYRTVKTARFDTLLWSVQALLFDAFSSREPVLTRGSSPKTLLVDFDARTRSAAALDQSIQRRRVRGMQPHATMRRRTAEAGNVVGAVDGEAVVEENRMRHR